MRVQDKYGPTLKEHFFQFRSNVGRYDDCIPIFLFLFRARYFGQTEGQLLSLEKANTEKKFAIMVLLGDNVLICARRISLIQHRCVMAVTERERQRFGLRQWKEFHHLRLGTEPCLATDKGCEPQTRQPPHSM
jgi:hypothetical protein